MPTLFQIKRFIQYWLTAVTEHSIHSPFFFRFYVNVVKSKSEKQSYEAFEQFREKLKKDNRAISIVNLGSGSFYFKESRQRVSRLAKTSLTPLKFNKLYARIINHAGHQQIVELGTSLGINTLYLSSKTGSFVTTFEGSPDLNALASSTFASFGIKHINLIEGDIDTTLPPFLETSGKLDFIFMDANHRYEPTKRYFQLFIQRIHNNSVVVIDDIHYSIEMERAWNEVRQHECVYGSIDLYRCGVLFFDPALTKQHYVMQF